LAIYRCGDFTVDAERLELRHNQELRHVEPQVFSVILHLIENRDRVVTRDELIDAIWHGRIISDAALSTRISGARKALKDNGREQRIIKTLPRRGFRFVAEIRNIGPSVPSDRTRWSDSAANGTLPNDWGAVAASNSTGGQRPVILIERLQAAADTRRAIDLAEEIRGDLVVTLSRRTGVKVLADRDEQVCPTYVLGGRCRVSGTRCRLSFTLVNVLTGETIWADRLDSEASDVFALIDHVTSWVYGAVRSHIYAFTGARFAEQPDDRLSIEELLWKAAYLLYRLDPDSSKAAQRTMEVAARLAPNNPMVLAVLAWSLAHTVWYGVDRIADVDVPRAMGLANKAVELGPRIDFVFCNRAHLRLWLKRDHEGCRTDAQRSLISNPGYHTGLLELSLADIFGGRPKAGADCLEVIINQVPADPLRPYFSAMAGLG
jgi:DNA-binding winged helix-turn-helix (wHTH) protein